MPGTDASSPRGVPSCPAVSLPQPRSSVPFTARIHVGGSCIIAPTGEIAAVAMTEDDELVTCDIDFSLGDYIRRTVFNFEKYRRIEHYGIITEQTGVVPSPENG